MHLSVELATDPVTPLVKDFGFRRPDIAIQAPGISCCAPERIDATQF